MAGVSLKFVSLTSLRHGFPVTHSVFSVALDAGHHKILAALSHDPREKPGQTTRW